nr:hypothetical protein [Polymorphobacter sp.]
MTGTVAAGDILPSQRGIEAILREMVERFGGVYGVRDLAAITGALARVERATNDSKSTFSVAAAIGYSLSKTEKPSIVARNLRVAWFAMFVTLRLNGWYLDARESDATAIVLGVADGSVDEAALIAFLEANSREVAR